MNREEYRKLSSPFISHEARSLYLFSIVANADSLGKYSVDYTRIIRDLTVYDHTSSGIIKFKPSSEQITEYLNELLSFNMIAISIQSQKAENFHGAEIIITKSETESQYLTEDGIEKLQRRYPMNPEWMPSCNYQTIARTAMLINSKYTDQELANFRAFWMAKGAVFNESEWDYRLVSYLKRIHVQTSFSVPIISQNIGLQKK